MEYDRKNIYYLDWKCLGLGGVELKSMGRINIINAAVNQRISNASQSSTE